jgi:uncharacterized protein YegJ (DUF2314 family)
MSSRMFVSEAAIVLPAARHRAVGIEGTVYLQSVQSTWSTSADPMVRVGFDGRFDASPADPLDSYPAAMVDPPEPERIAPAEPEPEPEPEPAPAVEVAPTPPVSPVFSDTSMPAPLAPPRAPEETDAAAPPTLIETQSRALTRLDHEVRTAWSGGLPSGDRLYVKAPFTSTDGGVEYLWVQVVSWREASIDGVLRSEPTWVQGLAVGDVIAVDQARVFDYLWRHADGSSEGNETEAFLR